MPDPIQDADNRPLVRAEEIAHACSVSTKHVHNLAARGEIPFIKLGTSIRFVPSHVEVALNLPFGLIRPMTKEERLKRPAIETRPWYARRR